MPATDTRVLPVADAVAQLKEKCGELIEAAVQNWDDRHKERAVADVEWALGALDRSLEVRDDA